MLIKQVLIVVMGLYSSVLLSQMAEEDRILIEKTFLLIENLCLQDNGQMWGIDLNLPCMVVDSKSRLIMANKPDRQGLLDQEGNIYIGIYPENKTIGSSITEFGGTTFAIVAYPFNFPESYLKVQMVHEIFHILQDTLGLKPPHSIYNNAHLDELNARICLRLEWEALEKAYEANNGDDRIEHISYALKFRNKRRSLYPDSEENENNMEIMEGIPEFTGHMITSRTFRDYTVSIGYLGNLIKPLESYAANFSYYSGSLYGGLLSAYDRNWTRELKSGNDLGDLLLSVSGISAIDTLIDRDFINANYDAAKIEQKEFQQWEKKEEQKLLYKRIFTEEPVLYITIRNWNMKLYPTDIMPLDSLGTLHKKIEIIDEWGKLTVNGGGCLINQDKVILPAKNISIQKNKVSAADWDLLLKDGWEVSNEDYSYHLIEK
jgi:hypothetical protein